MSMELESVKARSKHEINLILIMDKICMLILMEAFKGE